MPIGITASSGRTSRLKRFLSIPRYDGASRKRIKRGKNGDTSVERLVRPEGARTEKACKIIDDLIEPVVPVVQGQVVTYGVMMRLKPAERRKSFAENSA